ncbi:MAG: DUF3127 domain-containing protein [Planctomycetales bacterium]|nr:DUF3127 domain-containing protein [Planctomycetales bacterium]
MSEASVRGVVHLIEETKTFGQKGFRKRLVVLEQASERFTNYIPIDFVRDGCDAADELNVGDDVEVSYRLSGRKWQRDPSSDVRYFLSAEATNFKVVGKGSGGGSGDPNDYFDQAAGGDDDPPF